jgi:hypothetical protein
MKKFINLTNHSLNIHGDQNNTILTIPPHGVVARVTPSQTTVDTINGIDIVRTVFGTVEGLPAPEQNTVYIVSTLVLQALRDSGIHRDDVVAPDTSPASAVRNGDGQIIGVRRFQVL